MGGAVGRALGWRRSGRVVSPSSSEGAARVLAGTRRELSLWVAGRSVGAGAGKVCEDGTRCSVTVLRGRGPNGHFSRHPVAMRPGQSLARLLRALYQLRSVRFLTRRP